MLVMSQSVIFQSINQVSVNHSVILSRDSQSVKGWSVNQSRVSQSVKGQSVKYHSVTQSISQLVNLSVIHATFRLLALVMDDPFPKRPQPSKKALSSFYFHRLLEIDMLSSKCWHFLTDKDRKMRISQLERKFQTVCRINIVT